MTTNDEIREEDISITYNLTEENPSNVITIRSDQDVNISPGEIYLSDDLGDFDFSSLNEPKTDIDYKFNEGNLIQEFKNYIDSTYDGHYATNKFQSTEVIIERGHGTGFCMGNVDKYSNRYGNKGTPEDARKDLLKILHYALIQLYIHDKENS